MRRTRPAIARSLLATRIVVNGGNWAGRGLTSGLAMADPSGATGLAVTVNDNGASAILTSFGGENVDDQDVLVMYTYQGDANLDGRINADDYFQIDQGYRLQSDPAYRNYHGGDFDLSGAITADDFYLIDRSFLHQGASLGLAAMAALAAGAVAFRGRQQFPGTRIGHAAAIAGVRAAPGRRRARSAEETNGQRGSVGGIRLRLHSEGSTGVPPVTGDNAGGTRGTPMQRRAECYTQPAFLSRHWLDSLLDSRYAGGHGHSATICGDHWRFRPPL